MCSPLHRKRRRRFEGAGAGGGGSGRRRTFGGSPSGRPRRSGRSPRPPRAATARQHVWLEATEYGHVAKLITKPPAVYLAVYPLCIQTGCGFTCILCVQTPPGVYFPPRDSVPKRQEVEFQPQVETQPG
jgi:hypothetical protein